jgi:hypothetical protein
VNSAHPASILPETVDEETVRRLCGASAYAKADTLQRIAHVLSPKLGEHGPEANVRGTWRRVDHVNVHIRAGRLLPTCTRDGEVFCRHVGALLLQCLRDPNSLTAHEQPGGDAGEMPPSRRNAAISPSDTIEAPATELARLLEEDTVTHLRHVARRRGVRLSGSKKADLVQQLTPALMEPAGVDAAIADLDRTERIALDATHLLSAETPASAEVIREGVRTLGGSGEPTLDILLDTGLIALTNRHVYGPEGYVVPRAVAGRLPTLDHLAHHDNVVSADSASDEASPLGIIETIQVIVQATLTDHIGLRQPALGVNSHGYTPAGFIYDQTEVAAGFLSPDRAQIDGIRLVPPRLLTDDDLARLANHTGHSVEAVDFVVRLMLALQIAHAAPELAIRFDRLQAFLDMPPAVRMTRLVYAWLLVAGSSVSDLLSGPNGALELRWTPLFSMWDPPIQPAIASAVGLVARLVGRMTPCVQYNIDSFTGTVEKLTPFAAPALAQLRTTLPNIQAFTLSSRTGRGKQKRLAVGTPEGWSQFLGALVTAVLGGPLTWLGFAEVVAYPGQSQALRVRPEAAVLADRHVAADTSGSAGKLVIGDDLSVLVPPEASDLDILGLLSRAGTLIDASMNGLRYRLTSAGVQAVFDTGMTGPELTRLLSDRAGGALPKTAGKQLGRWWQHYGTIRLYDELTVLELSDDLLLAELLASTTLESAIVHTFSPRLIAIDSARAEDIIAELADRGHAPRIIEGS